MTRSRPFSAETRQTGDITVIDLHGEVDSFADDGLQAAYSAAEIADPPVIALNFNDVGYINSTGIALIVSLLARARKTNRRIVVFGLSDHYITIFHITRLSEFMTIFPDEATALLSVTSASAQASE